MSYRLIDANLVAESHAEANDMPCIYADLPRGLDGCHYDMREINELQAENAKLRKQYEAVIVEYRSEVAKLRELVRELYEDQCVDGDQWKYRDRMNELGVYA